MPEYPHPPVHLLEAPLLGDQQILSTFLHRLDTALNYWNGRPGNSKTITLHSSIHPCCDSYSPFLQHPWHHLAFFSVFVRSSVDPLSLNLDGLDMII